MPAEVAAARSREKIAMTDQATTQVAEPKKTAAVLPAKPKARQLPPFKVILHNDDVNTMEHVIETILLLTPLKQEEAILRMLEAHQAGCSLLLVTHKERAELYAEQFTSRQITVTIEADA